MSQALPTASVIKVAVMVEAFQQIADGRIAKDQLLTLDEGIKVEGSGVLFALRPGGTYSVADLLYLMIAISDNTATNLLVDPVGTKNVDDRMEKIGFPLVRLYRGTYRQGKPDMFPEEEKEFAARAEREVQGWRAAAASFGILFLAEWGDLSQLLTAGLAARTGAPLEVFIGSWLALVVVAGVAVVAGRTLLRHVRLSTIHRIGAGLCTIFAAIAAYDLVVHLAD